MIAVKEILKGIDSPSLDLVAEMLNKETTTITIDKQNWHSCGYKPKVLANIGYNETELFLRFTVEEKAIRAVNTENNSKVSQDSCCELFISPDSNDYYYNFEFNCIGTLLMGYRKMGDTAIRPDKQIMEQVRRLSNLGNQPFDLKVGQFNWTLTIAIPLKAFFRHELTYLNGNTFTANLYKCGDGLPKPHYLSLFPINTEKPSFHRPDYFGKLHFS